MTDIVRITKLDEVNIQIDSNRGIIQELSDYFTFTVPGYTFMPAFKNKVWDGKIRLLNIRDNTLYGGLCQYVEKFCKDREYEILKENFDNDELVTRESIDELNNRIKGISLIDNFHVQKLNKDYALVKIKFLGKIDKIINELKDKNINLKMIQGQWQIDII